MAGRKFLSSRALIQRELNADADVEAFAPPARKVENFITRALIASFSRRHCSLLLIRETLARGSSSLYMRKLCAL